MAIVSPLLIRELHTVLLRDKFRTYASPEEVDAFVLRLLACADLVDDPQQIPPVTRDPDDDYLVALARTEQNVAIVSGDQDLLTLDLHRRARGGAASLPRRAHRRGRPGLLYSSPPRR